MDAAFTLKRKQAGSRSVPAGVINVHTYLHPGYQMRPRAFSSSPFEFLRDRVGQREASRLASVAFVVVIVAANTVEKGTHGLS